MSGGRRRNLYRMPVHFGPMPGPRQGPDGEQFDWSVLPERTTTSVSFTSDAPRIAALLPPGFKLRPPAVVMVEVQLLRKLPWLAGRGYNTLGVKFPAEYLSKSGPVAGWFLAVLWENLADPIISGREELGFNKLYADIAEPRFIAGGIVHEAGWLGHRFFDLRIDKLRSAKTSPSPPPLPLLHYKYIPCTGKWGETDVAYATMTPVNNKSIIQEQLEGRGSLRFSPSSWEQLPTLFHIVNALADLPVMEVTSATVTRSVGATDLSEQIALKPDTDGEAIGAERGEDRSAFSPKRSRLRSLSTGGAT
ncbi:MAG: acetoacetate decarboxylase family protein [Rhizobiales bacterium]|nr:acetoacetate decarboxylase family protein [Hyphomicrobiales bacterium]